MRYSFYCCLLGIASSSLASALSQEESLFPGPSTVSAPPSVSGESFHRILRRNIGHMLEKREDGVRNEADVKNLNLTAWAADTTEACVKKLNNMTMVDNPSGIAACYNLPLLLSDTGVFAADLRLFQVSSPTGDWNDVPVNQYSVNLIYDGATVSPPRNLTQSEMDASSDAMAGSNLTKRADYEFIGQLDSTLLATQPSDTQLKAILTPHIYLEGITTTGKSLNLSIDSGQATFLVGVFANSTGANATELKAAAATATPFVLPGTKISIVPVGLYFFSAYTIVGLTIIGWGTLERAKFRDQYRKRVAMQGMR